MTNVLKERYESLCIAVSRARVASVSVHAEEVLLRRIQHQTLTQLKPDRELTRDRHSMASVWYRTCLTRGGGHKCLYLKSGKYLYVWGEEKEERERKESRHALADLRVDVCIRIYHVYVSVSMCGCMHGMYTRAAHLGCSAPSLESRGTSCSRLIFAFFLAVFLSPSQSLE
jgi:hypothetical protein